MLLSANPESTVRKKKLLSQKLQEQRDRGGRKQFIQLKFFLKRPPSSENKTILNSVKDNQVDEKAQHGTAQTDLNWIRFGFVRKSYRNQRVSRLRASIQKAAGVWFMNAPVSAAVAVESLEIRPCPWK